ncbi:MAG: hypothetical protein SOY85_00870 [Blautia sp.]|jgi:hypothetical protein|uniref:hypothetical protein n=1 Tax=Bacillota TaxID=1239 RepID=UPI001D07E5C9|nr:MULTISPECIES: hypothetical protein [Bacillota]MCB6725310.1 hypothetical protein [Blautia marasmi]MCI5964594.1 hypothetical protein [Clostridia bacterium]MCR0424406.1 hypothetical protein [[Clostridium] innocuum]MCQ5095371.1 hypothetical protein [Blautia producta]MCR0461841.1 hypothetical protein [[Clostridium] innocuum]
MAYDKNIPDVLQLLRLDLGNVDYTVPSDTTIARYTIDGDYFPRYCIADVADDADTMDIQGAIEETMHAILDYGGTPDDLRTAMGLVPEAEIDPDIIESGEYAPIDLGYCLDGQLTGFEVLDIVECDIKNALSGHQIENVMTALNNLPVNLRLPAAKALSQGDFTEWQAYQICKAFEAGIEEDTISRLIANPDLNHGQMRELRRIAEQMNLTSPDVSPYTKDMFKTLASGEYDVEKLHHTHGLMKAAKAKEISFDRDWLKLNSDQMNALQYGLISDVPMDVLADYTDGSYSADQMNALNIALIEGMEKQDIERLMNPDLSIEQVWGFYQVISGGRFTNEQLDILCDPTRPVAVMEAMCTGLTFGVDAQTVLRLADGSFAPEQMESLYLAAGDKDITPEMLDVIADASLKPEQMDALKISFQQGGSISDVEAEKKSMPRSVKYAGQAGKADAIRSTKLHETAKESREASAQLGSESHGDKAVEREELE